MQHFVLFDDFQSGQAILLRDLCAKDELMPEKWSNLDEYLQRGWQRGWHCALFADYESGVPLQKLPAPSSGSLKIFWFAEKRALDNVAQWLADHHDDNPAGLSRMNWSEDFDSYWKKIDAIQAAIARGETYQINYTINLQGRAYGSPVRLYARLRQNVPYGALAALPDGKWILCFSPELFLRIHSDGRISSEPMKGTAPILGDGEDEKRAHALRHDEKNRAENTMIVDLLRNDLGKLAQTGSVRVPEPFKVSAFGKVWQMTTKVQAKLPKNTRVADIFQAAFPCGSITGAPKRKSMEIIEKLEESPRGLYTGSIGFLCAEPDTHLGFSGCLNVVIRTLQLCEQKQGDFTAHYGVGSGIVMDSDAESEYAECAWKARFITDLPPECGLFETMRADGQGIVLLPQHLTRLAQSAAALNIPFDRERAVEMIQATLQTFSPEKTYRCKLILDSSGSLKMENAPYQALPVRPKVVLSEHILPVQNPLRRHKTSHRAVFDAAWQGAQTQGAFDALLFNANGFLLEGGRSSVKILYENQWLTPALEWDILNGITRANALDSGSLKEANITRSMLLAAQKIHLGNALHGWFEVDLV